MRRTLPQPSRNGALSVTEPRSEPPDLFNEMAFVGSLLRDHAAWDRLPELVDPADFADWRCKCVYEAMLDIYRTGERVDQHSVGQRQIGRAHV